MTHSFRRSLVCFSSVLALSLASVLSARADVLVDYQFNTNNLGPVSNGGLATGANAPYSTVTNSAYLTSATAIDSNGTPAALTYRLSGTLVNNGIAAAAYPVLDARITTSVPAPGVYFQFSMLANTDFSLNTVQFDLATGSSSPTTVRGADVRFSVDGFSTFTDLGTNGVIGNADAFTHFSLDANNALVQNGQTLTFRFLPFVSTGSAGGVRFDNIEVDGSPVTAPEPGSLAFIGIGSLSFFFARRKRQ